MNKKKKNQQWLGYVVIFEMSGENEMAAASGFSESCFDNLITDRHGVIGRRKNGDGDDIQGTRARRCVCVCVCVLPSAHSHDFIGEFTTSYRELSRGQNQFNVYEVRPRRAAFNSVATELAESEVILFNLLSGLNFTS